jgi:hypothetical protein
MHGAGHAVRTTALVSAYEERILGTNWDTGHGSEG